MYVQHNQGREHGRGGRSFGRNGGCGHGNNNEERGKMNKQNWCGRGRGRVRGGHSNRPNVECYNCGKYGYYAKDFYAEKKVEENANLVEEDEKKDEGILMMENEGITLNSDILWYLETGAMNRMCEHKHLFIDIQDINDGHVSFGDSTKVPVKGRRKICFSQKEEKEDTIDDIYYVP